jgi:hypothetical protein
LKISVLSLDQTSKVVGAPIDVPPIVLMFTFSGEELPFPKRLNPPFLLSASNPNAVPAIPTICSHRVVNSMQFSYELLYVTIQFRLYLHL